MKWNRQTAALFVLSCSATSALAADANAEWAQAQQLFQSGDFNRALPALLSLDKAFPSNVKLHYMIGMSYKNIGKPAQAERELGWVSSYAQDAALKQSALTALSELKSNADLARAKKSEEEKAAAAATASAGKKAPNPLEIFAGGLPPSKLLVRDSVGATVQEAYKKGWKPCTNSRCLNYSKPGWQKMSVAGHPDTDIWMNFGRMSFSQNHIGDIIDTAGGDPRDTGPCMTCMGTGWVKK